MDYVVPVFQKEQAVAGELDGSTDGIANYVVEDWIIFLHRGMETASDIIYSNNNCKYNVSLLEKIV